MYAKSVSCRVERIVEYRIKRNPRRFEILPREFPAYVILAASEIQATEICGL